MRRKYSAEVLKENHEVAAIIFNAFGLFYGVLVAFVVFVTWSGYDEATKNLQMEASEARWIFFTLPQSFHEPPKKIMQKGLIEYLTLVHNDEVQKMAEGDLQLFIPAELQQVSRSRYSAKWTRNRFRTSSYTAKR